MISFSPRARRIPRAATFFALAVLLTPLSVRAQDDATSAPLPAVPATGNTAETNTSAPGTSLRAADAVQEAFVRVAQRVRGSVVTIESLRNPRSSIELPDTSDDKPNGKKADPKKADPKDPKSKPAPADPDDEDEGDDTPFGMPFPFGQPADPRARPRAMGTGMVISRQGYILTNYHVVKGASFVRVLFNADSEQPDNPSATVVGFDEDSDLAVLKLNRTIPDLQPVQFGDSDAVRTGEWTIAIGAPFSQAQSVTVGVVSAKSRHLDGKTGSSLQDYIQTDASINPGNSGGPLFDLDGKVIGINTAILSPSRFNVGIGFAVPSNTVKQYLPRLMDGKTIERGFLGISYMRLNPGVAKEFGIEGGMHIGLLPEEDGKPVGPAKDAGLQVDDIITAVDGQPTTSSDEFRRYVSSKAPGTTLSLSVVRPVGNTVEKKQFALKLGTRPGEASTLPKLSIDENATVLGLDLSDSGKLTDSERSLFGFKPTTGGLAIRDITPGSPADEADLRRGLIIARVRVNGNAWQPVPNKAAYLKLEKTFTPGARVLVQSKDAEGVSVYNLINVPQKTDNLS